MGEVTVDRRRYDRGGNRRKHIGSSHVPEIVTVGGEIVGKCPTGRTPEWRQALLDDAVGYVTIEPYSAAFPKRLFAVDSDGAIYAAQTSNPGDSYHGYPYDGPLGKRILKALREKAVQKRCENLFDSWVKNHITVAGKPDL